MRFLKLVAPSACGFVTVGVVAVLLLFVAVCCCLALFVALRCCILKDVKLLDVSLWEHVMVSMVVAVPRPKASSVSKLEKCSFGPLLRSSKV